ncbi:YfiR family protein [Sphingobium nicotianae]|uniref:DUF4154 domain-containing protein n=1 Tax=Sphingobium nicotianae TaxID=2782607 RepID=A0A9X1IT88_9SPHN|nr:YfiR family protein [Sphingobium nicotianae]MBT2189072.1 DUF4154 domain-containing protein [Sphingobium nicotianae]
MRRRPENQLKADIAAKGAARLLKPLLPFSFVAGLLVLPSPAFSAAPAGEYQVKAAFLYNFARFVDWPAQSHRPGVLALCIVGTDPFGGDIDVVAGKPVGSDKLSVRRVDADDVADCQIIYIAGSDTATLGKVLTGIRGRPILTVGDSRGFAESGAVFNFYPENNKIRFEVNIDAARRTGLSISSQLLRLGRITRDKGRTSG